MAVVCQRPTFAACPGRSEPHGGGCYDVYAHPDDRADFQAAQRVCQQNGGGHLVQVRVIIYRASGSLILVFNYLPGLDGRCISAHQPNGK